ncbi:MAG: phage major capsid protein [Eubacteriales bacterium]|nr:phage major capsid protein [Eubacteriales bacterium]
MNKKLRELLNKINNKKTEIVNLVAEDKMDEAEAAKADLEKMQAKFDLMSEVMDSAADGIRDDATPVSGSNKRDAIHDFAEAARHGFAVMNNNESTPADGGYTVPEDIQTRINEFKEAHFSLESLVTVESVNTLSGARTYKTRAQHTGFTAVGEAQKIGKKKGPSFERVEFKVKKYGGYLPVTNELLEDSDANIASVLVEWLGQEDIATRNTIILDAINANFTQSDLTDLKGIKTAINTKLGQAFAPSTTIVTNDDGLNYLDTLTDGNGRPLLTPNALSNIPFDMVLAVGARRVPVQVVPNDILKTAANKVPFILGDMKEAIRLFDRRRITLKVSDIAATTDVNAFEEDLTIYRATERLDVQVVDDKALINGYITVA